MLFLLAFSESVTGVTDVTGTFVFGIGVGRVEGFGQTPPIIARHAVFSAQLRRVEAGYSGRVRNSPAGSMRTYKAS